MIRKYNINGAMYSYDLDHISVRDAMAIKTKTQLNLKPFSAGLTDLDPGCLQALAWLLLTTAGVTGADGEPIRLEDVDFDIAEFLVEEPDDDEVDPTSGGVPAGGVPPDSTSPQPESVTA